MQQGLSPTPVRSPGRRAAGSARPLPPPRPSPTDKPRATPSRRVAAIASPPAPRSRPGRPAAPTYLQNRLAAARGGNFHSPVPGGADFAARSRPSRTPRQGGAPHWGRRGGKNQCNSRANRPGLPFPGREGRLWRHDPRQARGWDGGRDGGQTVHGAWGGAEPACCVTACSRGTPSPRRARVRAFSASPGVRFLTLAHAALQRQAELFEFGSVEAPDLDRYRSTRCKAKGRWKTFIRFFQLSAPGIASHELGVAYNPRRWRQREQKVKVGLGKTNRRALTLV